MSKDKEREWEQRQGKSSSATWFASRLLLKRKGRTQAMRKGGRRRASKLNTVYSVSSADASKPVTSKEEKPVSQKEQTDDW